MKRLVKNILNISCVLLFIQFVFAGAAFGQDAAKPTPGEVIKMLQEGNERFYSRKATYPHSDAARIELAGRVCKILCVNGK